MQDQVLEIYACQSAEIRQMIDRSKKFHVEAGIERFARELVFHESKQSGTFRYPVLSFPPADLMCITFPREKYAMLFFVFRIGEYVRIDCVTATEKFWIGDYKPNDNIYRREKAKDNEHTASMIAGIGVVVSLINAPRKIIRAEETGSRQHRRAIQRLTGKPPMAWTNVTWELGKALHKSEGRDTQGSPKALHWCRAHPRRCEPHHPSAEWINGPFGMGWYKWIPDCWKGHPDYGFKFQKHTPRFGGGSAYAGGASPTILGDDALAMMEAAKAEALRQAGFSDARGRP